MEPYLRSGVLEKFRATVTALGGDAEDILARSDLPGDAIDIQGTYLPYRSYLNLLHQAAVATACPRFGLEMSRQGSAETLGIAGFIMTQAGTVGDAWRTLASIYGVHDNYGVVEVHSYPMRHSMSYSIPVKRAPGREQAYDVALGIASGIMRQLCGPGWRPLEIALPFPQPADLTPYHYLEAGGLLFDHHRFEMFFEEHWAEQSISVGVPEMQSELKYFLSPLLASETSNAQQAKKLITALLPMGECSLKVVAQMMNRGTRTLQQQLEQEGTSFQALRDEVRKGIALHHLRRGDARLTQVAMFLGYSELSAFTRSFKRWYGVSPREWIRQQG